MLLDKLWDDGVGGPHPEHGLEKLRKITTPPLNIKGIQIFKLNLIITFLSYVYVMVTEWVLDGEGESSRYQRSLSMPASPATPTTPVTPTTPASARKDNVWRSVFHPGSNLATRGIGAEVFDKPVHPNSPTVYDWYVHGTSFFSACMHVISTRFL